MDYEEIISNTEVFGLESAIRASKFPMRVDVFEATDELTLGVVERAQAPSGSGHDCWLKGVLVKCDLTATIKLWTQWERYHFQDIVSSQSTMHKLPKFDLDTAYIEYVDPRIIEIMKEKVAEYNANPTPEKRLELLYCNPCGMRLTAQINTNYLQLKTVYHQRRTHALPEWKAICKWIESLPQSFLITGKEEGSTNEQSQD